jgi:hypothetical protein
MAKWIRAITILAMLSTFPIIAGAAPADQTILNVSYDPTRELYKALDPHDQEEAFAMADLVVMHDGIVEQFGAPQDVRRAPRTNVVAEFLEIKGKPRPASQFSADIRSA